MATLKNSTLIGDGHESLNLSSASSIKLSPILAAVKNNFHRDGDGDDDGKNSNNNNNNQDDRENEDNGRSKRKSNYCKTIKFNGLREQSFGHGIYKVSEICDNDDDSLEQNIVENDVEDDEDYDDGTTEIPIWICGEPRFVNGVHDKTTCNDMIQALIDDELSQQVNTKNVAASRDLNDYVITEKWRDVEQILAGETLMLPIWNAWGVARNEVKFRLKINRTCTTTTTIELEATPMIMYSKKYNKIDHHKKTHRQHKKSKTEKISFLSKMLRKILRQGEEIENQLTTLTATNTNIHHPPPPMSHINTENSDDELLLVIDSTHSRGTTLINDDIYLNDSGDSGVHIKPSSSNDGAFNMAQNYPDTSESIISLKTPMDYFPPTTTSLYKLKTIHYDIKEKLLENGKLQKQKLALKSKLNKKYYQYNSENNYYKKIFKIESLANIDRIQENLEIYKRDIIQIEYEILKIKIRINDNLRVLTELNELLKLEKRLKMRDSLREKFTDGVFEFSDNNDTLIV